MSQAVGLLTAAAQLGLEAILVKPKRSIGSFVAHVTLREDHVDELVLTDQPVESGSQVTDHAYRLPSEVTIECAWSNSPPSSNILGSLAGAVTGTIGGISAILTGNSLDQVKATYQNLLTLQRARVPFDIYTGKRVYKNMLMRSLRVETEKETENALRVTVVCREIIFATVTTVSLAAPSDQQADPASTAPVSDKGTKQLSPGSNFNAGAAP